MRLIYYYDIYRRCRRRGGVVIVIIIVTRQRIPKYDVLERSFKTSSLHASQDRIKYWLGRGGGVVQKGTCHHTFLGPVPSRETFIK